MAVTEFTSPPAIPMALASDPTLARDLLVHLREQLRSGQRMLKVVEAQGAAIRDRNSKAVVAYASELQVEIDRREVLGIEHRALMERAGVVLGVEPDRVTMTALIELMDENDAHAARERQLTLLKLLRKVKQEHTTNQALMRQELNFLSHLLGMTGSTGSYGSGGQRPTIKRRAIPGNGPSLDLEA